MNCLQRSINLINDFSFPSFFADVSGVSTKVPCEEDTRPSRRKNTCPLSYEIPDQFPGGLGENVVSLSAKDRALPSEEGCSGMGMGAPVWDVKFVLRLDAESRRAWSRSSGCKSPPCKHSRYVLNHTPRAGRREVMWIYKDTRIVRLHAYCSVIGSDNRAHIFRPAERHPCRPNGLQARSKLLVTSIKLGRFGRGCETRAAGFLRKPE